MTTAREAERAGAEKGRPFQLRWTRERPISPAMPVIGLDHILITIPEGAEPQAIRFYCGLLGFSQIEKPGALAGRGGVWMRAGHFILHLGTDKDFVVSKRAHPGLLVDDLPSMIERLNNEGVELTFDVPLLGYDRVHIRDPFGNRLELLQRL
jgi:catechol 2,3-dioxygenase-like lactoylglutathione lyase family enzyme